MHHEYTDYLVGQIDDWEGNDDYGVSFALLDLFTHDFSHDDDGFTPDEFIGAYSGYISHVLGIFYSTRHALILHHDTGERQVIPFASHHEAQAAFDTLQADFLAWEDMAPEYV